MGDAIDQQHTNKPVAILFVTNYKTMQFMQSTSVFCQFSCYIDISDTSTPQSDSVASLRNKNLYIMQPT